MELVLNEQQTLLADAAAKLAAAHGGPRRARHLRDAHAEIDRDAWKAIGHAGWLGMVVPESENGLGLGALDLALAVEEAGRQLLMVPLVEGAVVAWALGNPRQTGKRSVALGAAMSGASLIMPALAVADWGFRRNAPEGGFQIDARGLLQGGVEQVAFAQSAHVFLACADTPSTGPALLLVEAEHLSRETRRNVDGSTSSRVTAFGRPTTSTTVLASGAAGAAIATGMRELLALWTSAELVGTATAALDLTTEYLKLRKQFGKPIGSFQALQHRMVDCYVDLELTRSLLYRVLAAWDSGAAHPAMISACKARISRGSLATVRLAVQLHGAMGYTDEHDIGLYYKRAVALAAKYGNEICHVDSFSAQTLPAAAEQS